LLIVFLLIGQKYILPAFTSKIRVALLSLTLIFILLLQWYVLNYLPIADCLPFKKGNNIAEQMKPPPGSRPDSVVIKYIYEKEGQRYEWAATELPSDFNTYKYIDRIDKVVRKGNAEPSIKGFSLVGVTEQDSAQIILAQAFAVLAFAQDFKSVAWVTEFKQLAEAAKTKNTIVYLGSPNLSEAAIALAGISNVQLFNVDFTLVRTVARTTPTILFLKNGTIMHKYSKKEIGAATQAITKQSL